MNRIIIILFALIFCTGGAFAKDIITHGTLQIDSDMELLLSHEYYKGIKVKSIKIKQINISKDTMIFDGQVLPGDPKNISVIVEIEDMKGNKTELYGYRSLSVGDFTHFVNTEE